ncbi:MAG: enoyl-CoA hydratase/isomerase family protein, partial [Spirochaetia bacterium]|nr:enoyl-CoA hydratase/isomerase family protein [Spirochaetia bacterium]
MNQYPFFEVEKHADKRTAVIWLSRADKRNAMDWSYWRDLPLLVRDLEKDKDIQVVIIAARGKSFSTGIDLELFIEPEFASTLHGQTGDEREALYKTILEMQEGMNQIAASGKVYICAVHKHCIGGALDLATACDIRLASEDASFSLRETKVAIVADMGSLNRLPAIIGQGN